MKKIIALIVVFVLGWAVAAYSRPPVTRSAPTVPRPAYHAPAYHAPVAPRAYNPAPCYRNYNYYRPYGYGYGGYGISLGYYFAPNPYIQTQYYYDYTTGITWYWTPLSGWQPLNQ
jgi:hypothetical protein